MSIPKKTPTEVRRNWEHKRNIEQLANVERDQACVHRQAIRRDGEPAAYYVNRLIELLQSSEHDATTIRFLQSLIHTIDDEVRNDVRCKSQQQQLIQRDLNFLTAGFRRLTNDLTDDYQFTLAVDSFNRFDTYIGTSNGFQPNLEWKLQLVQEYDPIILDKIKSLRQQLKHEQIRRDTATSLHRVQDTTSQTQTNMDVVHITSIQTNLDHIEYIDRTVVDRLRTNNHPIAKWFDTVYKLWQAREYITNSPSVLDIPHLNIVKKVRFYIDNILHNDQNQLLVYYATEIHNLARHIDIIWIGHYVRQHLLHLSITTIDRAIYFEHLLLTTTPIAEKLFIGDLQSILLHSTTDEQYTVLGSVMDDIKLLQSRIQSFQLLQY